MTHLLAELPAINAIRIGRLHHKPGMVTGLLGKSVRLVAHEVRFEDDSSFGVGGSCTLVSYRGRAFVVATRHQLALPGGKALTEGHFDTLRFATTVDGQLKNILVDRCLHEGGNPDQEYHDLLFFGVQQSWLETSADRPFFIPVESFSHDLRVRSFFYGHPLSKNDFKYHPPHAFVRQAVVDGELDRTYVSNAEFVRRYSYRTAGHDVNGFSGGAVFSLFGDLDEGFEVRLDGIIVRAGGGYLYAVDADYLIRAMDTFANGGGDPVLSGNT